MKKITVRYNVGSAVNERTLFSQGDYSIERIASGPSVWGTRKTLIKTETENFHCDSYTIVVEEV